MVTKLSKIVATLGPASESDDVIQKLIEEGVDIFRFNFKHNTVEWHEMMIKKVNSVANNIGATVGTLADIRVSVKRDLEALHIASRNEVDFIALSYILSSEDMLRLRKRMDTLHVDAHVIAKIETKKALDNLGDIIEVSDGIMVARGDLGLALPLEQVPYYQKIIIKESIKHTRSVITATEMLQSMVNNPTPTRAEISDIANATYDLTDAVMLSAETATGKYPVESVRMMKKTVDFNEKKNFVDSRLRFNFKLSSTDELLADAAYGLYLTLSKKGEKVAGFLIFTESGRSAQLISRYRPLVPIYAFASTKAVADRLVISYGVRPFHLNISKQKRQITKESIYGAIDNLIKKRFVSKNQILIELHSDYWDAISGLSSLKVIRV